MYEPKKDTFMSHTGFFVESFNLDENKKQWFLGGFPLPAYRFREYNSAYDVEEMLIEKIGKVEGMTPDSEFCILCLYFKTKAGAVSYLKKIEKYLDKVKELA